MNFTHFHNSCTRNRDHQNLLIMAGNAHKKILSQINVITCEGAGIETHSKLIVAAKQ